MIVWVCSTWIPVAKFKLLILPGFQTCMIFLKIYYLVLKSKTNVKHFSLDNTAKKQVDDQVKAGNEIESDKDSRVLFDVASESLKKKLPPTGR